MKRRVLIISLIICILSVTSFAGYKYHIYQKTTLNIYNMFSNGSEFITIHGKESLEVQRIFLHDIRYEEKEKDLSKEEEKWNWSIVYYPRSMKQYLFHKDLTQDYDKLLLNFKFYNDKENKRMVVFGNTEGGENKYGYIRENSYLYLQDIVKKSKK